MQTDISELLSTIETLTREAARECPTDMRRTLALIESRGEAIAQLAEFIKDSHYIMPGEFERIKEIECSGADFLGSVQERREELRKALCAGARQRSFAACVTGVLNLHPSSRNFAL
jgi:hypothetical protein